MARLLMYGLARLPVHIIEFLGYGKHVEAAPSGPNWETTKQYMTLREKDLKAGTVSDALLALLDDNVQYHVKSVFSTTDYKGKAEVEKYLAEPAQMISHSYEEDGYKPEQDGNKITVYSDAKKFGLWLKVRAVFTFGANGKIVDVWAGKA